MIQQDQGTLRKAHFDDLRKALDDGLDALAEVRSPAEADAVHARIRERMQRLQREYERAFGK